MLPYKVGNQMIIDPTVKPSELYFGEVPLELYKKIGTVTEVKYMHHPLRSNVYELDFGDGQKNWFKENEIT